MDLPIWPLSRWSESFARFLELLNSWAALPAKQPQRYREGSALAFLPLGVPQVIVAGGLLRQSQKLVNTYEAQARAKGDRITVLTLEGAGHFDMLGPDTSYGKALLEAISSLMAARNQS